MAVAPPGVSFVSSVYVPNTKSVAHFLLADFGEGYLLVVTCYLVVTGGKQSQLLLCPTEVQLGLQAQSGV